MERKDIVKEFLRKPSVIFTYFGHDSNSICHTALLVWLPKYFQVTSGMDPEEGRSLAGAVMMLALVGAPLGGYIIGPLEKNHANRADDLSCHLDLYLAMLLFLALLRLQGNIAAGYTVHIRIFIMQFISGAAAVTQDVIHPGLRATSYAIAVLVQNLLGSFTAPIALGAYQT